MGRMSELYQEQQGDAEQPSEQDYQGCYLWTCLEALRGHISAECFEQAEKELGFAPPTITAQPAIDIDCAF